MASYPNIPTENIYPKFDKIGTETSVYYFPWGKKIYGFNEGQVTAIIPLAIVYTHQRGGHYASGSLWAKVAGKGECYYPLGAKFFATIEDYTAYSNGEKGRCLHIKSERLTNYMARCGYKMSYATFSSDYLMGWCVSRYHIEPQKCQMSIEKMWLDADGLHATFVENNNTFLNYDDAVKAQKASIKIVDFDDETATEIKEFSVGVKISIKGTTKADATNEIVKALENIGYRVSAE